MHRSRGAQSVQAAVAETAAGKRHCGTESPTNISDLATWWPTIKPASYYTFASGALGWGAPAALAQKGSGTGRPVVAVIGDGSLQYSIQCLASAAQHKLKVIYVIPCNGEYAALKEFAELEKTPNVPALDLPELDIVSTAKGFGWASTRCPLRACGATSVSQIAVSTASIWQKNCRMFRDSLCRQC